MSKPFSPHRYLMQGGPFDWFLCLACKSVARWYFICETHQCPACEQCLPKEERPLKQGMVRRA